MRERVIDFRARKGLRVLFNKQTTATDNVQLAIRHMDMDSNIMGECSDSIGRLFCTQV